MFASGFENDFDGWTLNARDRTISSIVDDPAVGIAERAVEQLRVAQTREIVGDQVIGIRDRLRPAKVEAPHVRDIEHADRRPDADVLGYDSVKLDRQVIPGKVNHLAARGQMPFVEWSQFEHGRLSYQKRCHSQECGRACGSLGHQA